MKEETESKTNNNNKNIIAKEQLRRNMLPYNFIQNGRGSTYIIVTSLYILTESNIFLVIVIPDRFSFSKEKLVHENVYNFPLLMPPNTFS